MKFNPNDFCIDDLFDYLGKKGKKIKDKIKKLPKKKSKKKKNDDSLMKTASSIETPTVKTDDVITIDI